MWSSPRWEVYRRIRGISDQRRAQKASTSLRLSAELGITDDSLAQVYQNRLCEAVVHASLWTYAIGHVALSPGDQFLIAHNVDGLNSTGL